VTLRHSFVKSGQTRKEKASSPIMGNEAWVYFAEAGDHGNHGSRRHFSNVKRSENIPFKQKGQDFEMLLNGAAHREW